MTTETPEARDVFHDVSPDPAHKVAVLEVDEETDEYLVTEYRPPRGWVLAWLMPREEFESLDLKFMGRVSSDAYSKLFQKTAMNGERKT